MDVAEALARLVAAGTEQNRKVFRRHGAHESLFGVSFAVLHAMRKETKRDGALARGLWASGNHDARLLACMVAVPYIARAWDRRATNAEPARAAR
jgi:3-methyladenine DNA glycosylase AlkD